MGRRTVKLLNALGGEGLTTTIGWPQEVGQRWADKIWPLSHKLVAQAAGLGVIGLSRNFLHQPLRRLLPDRHRASPISSGPRTTRPSSGTRACSATSASPRARPRPSGRDGNFDFFACYNHTYRDSIPGFLDLVGDLAGAQPAASSASAGPTTRSRRSGRRSSFKVEYRCFNCVATCPAEIEHAFHDDRDVRRTLPRRDAEAADPHARRSRTRSS